MSVRLDLLLAVAAALGPVGTIVGVARAISMRDEALLVVSSCGAPALGVALGSASVVLAVAAWSRERAEGRRPAAATLLAVALGLSSVLAGVVWLALWFGVAVSMPVV